MKSLCRMLPPAAALAATLTMLTAGCSTSASSTAGQAAQTASPAQTASATPASPAQTGSATPTSPPPSQPAPTPTRAAVTTPAPVPPSVSPVRVTGSTVLAPDTKVYFAEAGDINGTVVYRPACASGCALSGDSTAFLWNMTWRTWTSVDAVGTGTEQLDDCEPSCAAGHVYSVPVTVTFSDPNQAGCTAADSRVVWTRASFVWPDGLPAALTGQNAPLNPFTYPGLETPSC
jgi:hypothetical protein